MRAREDRVSAASPPMLAKSRAAPAASGSSRLEPSAITAVTGGSAPSFGPCDPALPGACAFLWPLAPAPALLLRRRLVGDQHALALVRARVAGSAPTIARLPAAHSADCRAQGEEVVRGAKARMLEQPVRALAAALQEARLQQPQLLHGRVEAARDRERSRCTSSASCMAACSAGIVGCPSPSKRRTILLDLAPQERGEQECRATRACPRPGARRWRAAPPGRRARLRGPPAPLSSSGSRPWCRSSSRSTRTHSTALPESRSFRISSKSRAWGTFSSRCAQLADRRRASSHRSPGPASRRSARHAASGPDPRDSASPDRRSSRASLP